MTNNPRFDAMVAKMQAIHKKKSADYAQSGNPYSNFEAAAAMVGCSVDVVFRVLIAIKMARLRELQMNGKTPENESVEDSQDDLALYSTLYASYTKDPSRRDAAEAIVKDMERIPMTTAGGGISSCECGAIAAKGERCGCINW